MPDFHIPNDPEWKWAYDAILFTVGEQFPKADPTTLRAMGDELYGFTNQLLNGVAATAGIAGAVNNHLEGPAADAFNQFSGEITRTVPAGGNISTAMGGAAYDFALNSESTQYNIVIAAFTQVVEISIALASGFGAAAVPALIKIGQKIVGALIDNLRRRLQNTLMMIAFEAVEEGLEELWQSAAAQVTQILEGNRRSVDYKDLAMAFAGGVFIGGGVAAVHAVGGKLFPKINQNVISRETLSGLGETLFEGLFTMMVGGGGFNPFATLSSSVIGGMAHHYATQLGNQVNPNLKALPPATSTGIESTSSAAPPVAVEGPPPPYASKDPKNAAPTSPVAVKGPPPPYESIDQKSSAPASPVAVKGPPPPYESIDQKSSAPASPVAVKGASAPTGAATKSGIGTSAGSNVGVGVGTNAGTPTATSTDGTTTAQPSATSPNGPTTGPVASPAANPTAGPTTNLATIPTVSTGTTPQTAAFPNQAVGTGTNTAAAHTPVTTPASTTVPGVDSAQTPRPEAPRPETGAGQTTAGTTNTGTNVVGTPVTGGLPGFDTVTSDPAHPTTGTPHGNAPAESNPLPSPTATPSPAAQPPLHSPADPPAVPSSQHGATSAPAPAAPATETPATPTAPPTQPAPGPTTPATEAPAAPAIPATEAPEAPAAPAIAATQTPAVPAIQVPTAIQESDGLTPQAPGLQPSIAPPASTSPAPQGPQDPQNDGKAQTKTPLGQATSAPASKPGLQVDLPTVESLADLEQWPAGTYVQATFRTTTSPPVTPQPQPIPPTRTTTAADVHTPPRPEPESTLTHAASPDARTRDDGPPLVNDLSRKDDGRWYADGAELVIRDLPASRTVIALLSDADVASLAGTDWLPPGQLPVVLARGEWDVIRVPVRDPDGSVRDVFLNPEQLALVTAKMPGVDVGSVVLVSCGTGATSGGFAHRYATARNDDVLAQPDGVIAGKVSQPGQPITVGGQPWSLFVPNGLGGEGWDTLNDTEVPIDGFLAVDDANPTDNTGLHLSGRWDGRGGNGHSAYYEGALIPPGPQEDRRSMEYEATPGHPDQAAAAESNFAAPQGVGSYPGSVVPDHAVRLGPASTVDRIDRLLIPQHLSDMPKWIRQRVDNGEFPVPFFMDDAMDDAASNVPFGVEIEFTIPATDREADGESFQVDEILEFIGKELHEAGLTASAEQQSQHSRAESDRWLFETDSTVDGEIVSPILRSSPATWDAIRKIEQILAKAGAVVHLEDPVTIPESTGHTISMEAGGHVHVSSGFYAQADGATAYKRLAGLFHRDEEVLYRLAGNPLSEFQHSFDQRKPGWDTGMPYSADPEAVIDAHLDRKLGLSFNQVALLQEDHPEWRLWRGSLIAAVIQTHVKVSVGLQLAALRDHDGLEFSGQMPALGSFHRPDARPPDPYGGWRIHDVNDQTEYDALSRLLRTAFHRQQDMLQAAALFFLNDWATDSRARLIGPVARVRPSRAAWPVRQRDAQIAELLAGYQPQLDPTSTPLHAVSGEGDNEWYADGERVHLKQIPNHPHKAYQLLADSESAAPLSPVPDAIRSAVPIVVRVDGGTVRFRTADDSVNPHDVRIEPERVARIIEEGVDYRAQLRLAPHGSGKFTERYIQTFIDSRPDWKVRGKPGVRPGDVFIPANYLFTPPPDASVDSHAPSWVRFSSPRPGGQLLVEVVAETLPATANPAYGTSHATHGSASYGIPMSGTGAAFSYPVHAAPPQQASAAAYPATAQHTQPPGPLSPIDIQWNGYNYRYFRDSQGLWYTHSDGQLEQVPPPAGYSDPWSSQPQIYMAQVQHTDLAGLPNVGLLIPDTTTDGDLRTLVDRLQDQANQLDRRIKKTEAESLKEVWKHYRKRLSSFTPESITPETVNRYREELRDLLLTYDQVFHLATDLEVDLPNVESFFPDLRSPAGLHVQASSPTETRPTVTPQPLAPPTEPAIPPPTGTTTVNLPDSPAPTISYGHTGRAQPARNWAPPGHPHTHDHDNDLADASGSTHADRSADQQDLASKPSPTNGSNSSADDSTAAGNDRRVRLLRQAPELADVLGAWPGHNREPSLPEEEKATSEKNPGGVTVGGSSHILALSTALGETSDVEALTSTIANFVTEAISWSADISRLSQQVITAVDADKSTLERARKEGKKAAALRQQATRWVRDIESQHRRTGEDIRYIRDRNKTPQGDADKEVGQREQGDTSAWREAWEKVAGKAPESVQHLETRFRDAVRSSPMAGAEEGASYLEYLENYLRVAEQAYQATNRAWRDAERLFTGCGELTALKEKSRRLVNRLMDASYDARLARDRQAGTEQQDSLAHALQSSQTIVEELNKTRNRARELAQNLKHGGLVVETKAAVKAARNALGAANAHQARAGVARKHIKDSLIKVDELIDGSYARMMNILDSADRPPTQTDNVIPPTNRAPDNEPPVTPPPSTVDQTVPAWHPAPAPADSSQSTDLPDEPSVPAPILTSTGLTLAASGAGMSENEDWHFADRDDLYQVFCHANKYALVVGGAFVDASELAAMITNDPKWRPGLSIVLDAPRTSIDPDRGFAAQLALALPGIKIFARKETSSTDPRADSYVEPPRGYARKGTLDPDDLFVQFEATRDSGGQLAVAVTELSHIPWQDTALDETKHAEDVTMTITNLITEASNWSAEISRLSQQVSTAVAADESMLVQAREWGKQAAELHQEATGWVWHVEGQHHETGEAIELIRKMSNTAQGDADKEVGQRAQEYADRATESVQQFESLVRSVEDAGYLDYLKAYQQAAERAYQATNRVRRDADHQLLAGRDVLVTLNEISRGWVDKIVEAGYAARSARDRQIGIDQKTLLAHAIQPSQKHAEIKQARNRAVELAQNLKRRGFVAETKTAVEAASNLLKEATDQQEAASNTYHKAITDLAEADELYNVSHSRILDLIDVVDRLDADSDYIPPPIPQPNDDSSDKSDDEPSRDLPHSPAPATAELALLDAPTEHAFVSAVSYDPDGRPQPNLYQRSTWLTHHTHPAPHPSAGDTDFVSATYPQLNKPEVPRDSALAALRDTLAALDTDVAAPSGLDGNQERGSEYEQYDVVRSAPERPETPTSPNEPALASDPTPATHLREAPRQEAAEEYERHLGSHSAQSDRARRAAHTTTPTPASTAAAEPATDVNIPSRGPEPSAPNQLSPPAQTTAPTWTNPAANPEPSSQPQMNSENRTFLDSDSDSDGIGLDAPDALNATPAPSSEPPPPFQDEVATFPLDPPPASVWNAEPDDPDPTLYDGGLILEDKRALLGSVAQFYATDQRYNVHAHGNRKEVRVGDSHVSPEALARMILKDPKWGRRPVLLLVCETGAGGRDAFAREVFRKLGSTVPVIAPEGFEYVTYTGHTYSRSKPSSAQDPQSPNEPHDDSRFVAFMPNRDDPDEVVITRLSHILGPEDTFDGPDVKSVIATINRFAVDTNGLVADIAKEAETAKEHGRLIQELESAGSTAEELVTKALELIEQLKTGENTTALKDAEMALRKGRYASARANSLKNSLHKDHNRLLELSNNSRSGAVDAARALDDAISAGADPTDTAQQTALARAFHLGHIAHRETAKALFEAEQLASNWRGDEVLTEIRKIRNSVSKLLHQAKAQQQPAHDVEQGTHQVADLATPTRFALSPPISRSAPVTPTTAASQGPTPAPAAAVETVFDGHTPPPEVAHATLSRTLAQSVIATLNEVADTTAGTTTAAAAQTAVEAANGLLNNATATVSYGLDGRPWPQLSPAGHWHTSGPHPGGRNDDPYSDDAKYDLVPFADRPSSAAEVSTTPPPPNNGNTSGAATIIRDTHTSAPEATQVPSGLALLDADETADWATARNYPEHPDEYRVFVHGNPDGVVVDNKLVTPQRLAELINEDSRSHGKPIALIGCDIASGDTASGYDVLLANQQGITGVFAPTRNAWVPRNGHGRIFSMAKTHTPDGRPRLDRSQPGNWRHTTPGNPPVILPGYHLPSTLESKAAQGRDTYQLPDPATLTSFPRPAPPARPHPNLPRIEEIAEKIPAGLRLITPGDQMNRILSERYDDRPDRYHVFVHGDLNGRRIRVGNEYFSVEELAYLIRGDTRWQGRLIHLHICMAGVDFDAGFAARFTKVMRGTRVLGANGIESISWSRFSLVTPFAGYDPDGRLSLARPQKDTRYMVFWQNPSDPDHFTVTPLRHIIGQDEPLGELDENGYTVVHGAATDTHGIIEEIKRREKLARDATDQIAKHIGQIDDDVEAYKSKLKRVEEWKEDAARLSEHAAGLVEKVKDARKARTRSGHFAEGSIQPYIDLLHYYHVEANHAEWHSIELQKLVHTAIKYLRDSYEPLTALRDEARSRADQVAKAVNDAQVTRARGGNADEISLSMAEAFQRSGSELRKANEARNRARQVVDKFQHDLNHVGAEDIKAIEWFTRVGGRRRQALDAYQRVMAALDAATEGGPATDPGGRSFLERLRRQGPRS